MSRLPAFTLEPVVWTPWVETIDEIDATDDQKAIVDEITSSRASRTYWATLAHDAAALRARHHLFPETLRGKEGDDPPGAPKSDLELAAVATSKATGCVYCASVHARAYERLTDRPEIVRAVLEDGVDAGIPEREKALVAFASRIATNPGDLGQADLRAMRGAGFTDVQIFDIAHAAAMFAWANRLMLTLGSQTMGDPPVTRFRV